ncbi:MAG TPA: helix-turn-helix transcriptional regulator [Ferruginibacter sp.]|nr:helix-turn-helix transcriptional regulator [Ferruginibacter sp.]
MPDLTKMDIKLKIGQRIKVLRKEIGLSQEALAYKAEVDRTYVTDVENGRRNVSVEILEKIIIALNISVKDFFDSKEFKS